MIYYSYVNLQVLLTLSFLASGSHQKSVGKDFNVKISQKSVSRVIKIIVEGLNAELDKWVVFPSSSAQRELIKEGYGLALGPNNVITFFCR